MKLSFGITELGFGPSVKDHEHSKWLGSVLLQAGSYLRGSPVAPLEHQSVSEPFASLG